jgi:hypothetical protein
VIFWFERLIDGRIMTRAQVADLLAEADGALRIVSAARRTVRLGGSRRPMT